MDIEEIIIIGGGLSLKRGLEQHIEEYINLGFVINVNYSFRYFPKATALTFYDRLFYKTDNIKLRPDIYDELATIPLIVGPWNIDDVSDLKHQNTILIDLKPPTKDSFVLTGQFAVAWAELMQPKRIFLLGFDWTTQPHPKDKKLYTGEAKESIHFYGEEIKHVGINRTRFYDQHDPSYSFGTFGKNCKIFNVCPESNIECFEKIDYDDFFKMRRIQYNQDDLRDYIKLHLKGYIK